MPSTYEVLEAIQSQWIVALCTLLVSYQLSIVLYNLTFHPLAAFPGPFLGRCTLLWRLVATMKGHMPQTLQKQHQKYGPVVRVSPNELSFCTLQSYKDIYGFPPPGGAQCTKSGYYDIVGSGFKIPCVVSERDPTLSGKKKKNLSAGFSPKALAAQENIMHQHINAFIEGIGLESQKSSKGTDMVEWLAMTSFDLSGEMAFGEPFGCIASGKQHFWIDIILQHLKEITLMDNLRRFPFLLTIINLCLSPIVAPIREKHSQYSRDKVRDRIEKTTTRQDFLTGVAEKVKSGEVSLEEMTAHASTLIIAGGETTATTLAAAVLYTLKDPGTTKRLTDEIRSRFSSFEEITAAAAQQLPYVQAVINEAMRVHPATAQGLPRVSPGLEIDGHWVPKGTDVFTCTWATSRNPEYFDRPEEFRPERWTDPNSTDVTEASQPFSLGYRACMGRSFAYMEMSLVLCKLFYTYDLELEEKDIDWPAVSKHYSLWINAHYHVHARRRLS
ncbi:putative Cytochrome P450 [Rosellinia necatrix]|uniref:Putative Cytochrome P450 n=1 Tax=Rosellinia necatrix TaxID=77044 RepID=A0A1W2TBB4_ROSNE|nr:putative Cytochrome P450 [Rosellinia necatrix]